jgi:hypothetical protein
MFWARLVGTAEGMRCFVTIFILNEALGVCGISGPSLLFGCRTISIGLSCEEFELLLSGLTVGMIILFASIDGYLFLPPPGVGGFELFLSHVHIAMTMFLRPLAF